MQPRGEIAARRAFVISEAGVAMRVLIAGATGAIGRPLVRCLNRDHHSVFALARSPESSRAVTELGAEPVTADALDAAAVKAVIARVRPDAIINELTSLPRHYTPAEMRAAAERDRKVRIEGNANLLAALQNAGVRRYLLQSSGYWYAPAVGLADESEQFAFDGSPAVAAGTRRYANLEAAASGTSDVEFAVFATVFSMVRAPGSAATATWVSRSASNGFRLLAPARACAAGFTSTMRLWQRQPRSNALPACTTSLIGTRRPNAYGYLRSRELSARRRHRRLAKKRRSRVLAPIRSTTRPGFAEHRTRRQDAS